MYKPPPKYKPPKLVTQKTLRLIAPPNISLPGGLYLEIALTYKVKQSKTVNFVPTIRLAQSILKRKFSSVDKPLRIQAPPKISPSKRAFEKYKPRGLFSEFYGKSFGRSSRPWQIKMKPVMTQSC